MAAVNSAKGLVVPNIKAVQSQSVFEIAGELERLVALAQEGTLPADDLADGTHTPASLLCHKYDELNRLNRIESNQYSN